MSKTVFVGLSGGVDSAVSAALLKQQGFNVVGVFIKIWQPEFIECAWATDRLDAMRVAVALEIPFREIDLSSDYKRMVVEDMISAYRHGITPNPDVLCNRHIKFGSFMNYALQEGADFVATGHYVRKSEIRNPKSETNHKSQSRKFELLRGKDRNKDQSYFLYTLNQHDLARTIFPVGGLLKKQVRSLASKFRLPVASKPDSQGLCFVGDVSMQDFLSRFLKLESGRVLDASGAVIGIHNGAALYTIGQRHGFRIEQVAENTSPYYVIAVDVSANTIRVSPEREMAARKDVSVNPMHWIAEAPAMPLQAEIQTRYREQPRGATITQSEGFAKVTFAEPHIAAAGQSLVAYQGDTCFGGGVIAS